MIKNLFYGTRSEIVDSIFDDVIDKFGSLVEEERLQEEDLRQFNLQPCEEKIFQFAMQEYEKKRNHSDDYDEDEYKEDISQLNPDGYANETYMDQNKSRSNFYPGEQDPFRKRGP